VIAVAAMAAAAAGLGAWAAFRNYVDDDGWEPPDDGPPL
jgi:hypothetical protein